MEFEHSQHGLRSNRKIENPKRGGAAFVKRKDRANGISSFEQSAPLIHADIPADQAIVQGKWIIEKDTGKNLNLRKTEDETIYMSSKTGAKYKVTAWDVNDEPIEVEEMVDSEESDEDMGGEHEDYRFNNWDTYKNWTKKSQDVQIVSEYGPVSAFQNRGAPKIGSKKGDFGDEKMGDSYKEYIQGLRSGKESDSDIATDLLSLNDEFVTSDLEKRAAAMLHTTVYLSEEWRKQGAAKIYRSFLRLIAEGSKTFDDFLKDFAFIKSADEGRYMVSRFKDVKNKDAKMEDLDDNEKDVYNAMSPTNDGDFSSEDEMMDEKQLSKQRDHSKIFKENSTSTTGFKDVWG